MRKYKIEPRNSYYYYKKQKNKLKQILIVCAICFVIGFVFFIMGRWSKAVFEITSQETGKKDQDRIEAKETSEAVYFDGTKIDYSLHYVRKDVKGIYIPASKLANYEEYISLAKHTSINAFVIDVKNDYGYLTFPSSNPKLKSMGCVLSKPPAPNMQNVISRLCEEDIYPIARIVTFKDNVATKKFPDRAIKSRTGSIYTNKAGDTWLNPYDKNNWEYLMEISKEAINMGFKEIQFDYIRFHESMNKDTVLLDNNISKKQIITAFAKYMYEHLKTYGVNVSADVFGAVITSKIDSETVGQDFSELSKNLDYICPMVYPSHYAEGSFGIKFPHLDAYGIILRAMELAQDEIKKNPREVRKAIIRPWLQDFTMSSLKPYQPYGEKQIRAQIKGTYDSGLDEWMFWNASGKYTQAGLQEE